MSENTREDPTYESLTIDPSLLLRQLHISEADELYAIVDSNREYLSKWLPWVDGTQSPSDSELFINDTLRKRNEGSEYGYGIIADGKLAGHISLMHVSDGKDPEIGYWIDSKESGKGLTTKAARAITDFGLQTLNLKRIVIKAEPDNYASNRIAEKLGYTLEGSSTEIDTGKLFNIWSVQKSF